MACNLNLRKFPHDVQTCTVMLESCKSNVFSIFRVHAWIDLIFLSPATVVSRCPRDSPRIIAGRISVVFVNNFMTIN